MGFRTNGLVSLLTCFAIGCAGHSTILRNGIAVKYEDDNYFYHYSSIRNTGYYVVGQGESRFIAKITAQEHLMVINKVINPTLFDLEKADELGEIRWIIEPMEYEELKFIRIIKNIRDSASK